ncbi:phytanoyl-CoA dioxygenase family protein [Terricaulis silvestris]|uniref:Phytanoyl-CoA dioxygenase (PhyH) n=1 Tax=Terricaulis silvestris TaxID=2686094 RepID=A0A6I6MML5_9CAUL|nr:phytanoyl-CoA dioxygenase family protein [Terricaulis silvestris]QGZ96530.1 Phytanoyl-CoA dioxygenase (PhyH) [Terricaulis silvestris]
MSEADQLADDIIVNGFAIAESRLGVSVLDRLRCIPTEQLASSAVGATRTSSDGGNARVRLMPDCPDLWPLHQDQLLLTVTARVLRNPFALKYLQSRTVHSGSACQTLHMDCDVGTGAGKLLAFIWMLDSFDTNNGATQFIPGSHRSSPAGPPMLAIGPAGSLIIYDRAVLHGYTPNQSNADRRSIQGGFDPTAP